MEEDWELDDSTSSIISSEASASTLDEDASGIYFNDPKTELSGEKTDKSLGQEFENEAAAMQAIDNDRVTNSPMPPPPPAEDISYDSGDEDDVLSLKDHIIAAARQSQGFGDETVDILMDAENRLKTVPSPPHSLSSLFASSNNECSKESLSNHVETNDRTENNYNSFSEDDDGSEISDGAESLFRGPIMAAKSFARVQQEKQSLKLDSLDENTPTKVRMPSPVATKESSLHEEEDGQSNTPSASRRGFISSLQKMEPWSPWSMQQQERRHHQESSTPSTTRVKFMPSAQKEHPESDFTTTPSTSRRDFIHSAHKSELTQPWSPWSSQQQEQNLEAQVTPSSARLQFLPSAQKAINSSPDQSDNVPSSEKATWASLSSLSSTVSQSKVAKQASEDSPNQDSVSSIGANSPSAYVKPTNPCKVQQRNDDNYQRTITPSNVTFESSTANTSSMELEIQRSSPIADEAEAFLQMNRHILQERKSLDNIIELGERQMKMGAGFGGDRKSDNIIAGKPSSFPAKKPFLRKGARKEPSALHKLGRVNSAAGNTATSNAASESASERKARLEQLEKMQEDLMKDLQRRNMRKDEAQKERRKERNEVDAEKRSLIKKKIGSNNATVSATKSPKRTPLKISPANGTSKQQTSSQVRPKTAAKQTVAKRTEPKVKSSSPRELSVSPVPIAGRKSLKSTGSNSKATKVVSETCQMKSSTAKARARSTSRLRSSTQRPANNKSKEDTMEDMKKKEEEQMALIKNMRKRQEVALREAEGERERAKAWAAAERESVKKWVEEQRTLIRKDRHKAANAAILAAKKASRRKDDGEDSDALNAELEEMRLELKKLKVEAEEAGKLREQVRKQERMISTLKRGETANARNSASSNLADSGKRRAVLGDRTSKENMQQRPKTATGNNVEQNASQKLTAEERENKGNSVDNDGLPQRKPYNAADYASKTPGVQTHSIPQFVSAPTPPGQGGRSSQIVTYQNGTTKEILSDGTTTISFVNGDRKRTYANEKKGIEVYYYAATKVRLCHSCLFCFLRANKIINASPSFFFPDYSSDTSGRIKLIPLSKQTN